MRIFIYLLKNIRQSVAEDDDNEELQKCLIDIAEIAPKYLKSCLDDVFDLCINVSSFEKINFSSLN